MIVQYDVAAADEFEEAIEFLEDRRPGIGERFEAEVKRAIQRVIELPEAWPEVQAGVRRILVDGFPYGIFYLVDGNVLYVVAVAHLRRRPGYWKKRLN